MSAPTEPGPWPAPWAADPDWPRLQAGRRLGQVTSVAAGPDGEVWLLHRGTPPILCLDSDGAVKLDAGADELPDGGGHFLRLDADGQPWITDTRRHQVLAFDRGGRLLATLGRREEPGLADDQFDQPTDIAFLPSGGFFVSDGYGNARIKEYAPDGTLAAIWGRPGRLPGEFDTPHALALDSRGHLYVSDRGNSRICVFDTGGRFLAEWRTLPYIDGLAIAPDDSLIAVTGRANGVLRLATLDPLAGEPPVLEAVGTRYSTYRELVTHVVPPAGTFNMLHGVAIAADGTVYLAEVRARRAQRLRRTQPFVDQQNLPTDRP